MCLFSSQRVLMSNDTINTSYACEDITWSDPNNWRLLCEWLSSDTYTPCKWQAQGTANALDRRDILLIAGTGQGKSFIIYLPAIARPEKITPSQAINCSQRVVTPPVLLQKCEASIACQGDLMSANRLEVSLKRGWVSTM